MLGHHGVLALPHRALRLGDLGQLRHRAAPVLDPIQLGVHLGQLQQPLLYRGFGVH